MGFPKPYQLPALLKKQELPWLMLLGLQWLACRQSDAILGISIRLGRRAGVFLTPTWEFWITPYCFPATNWVSPRYLEGASQVASDRIWRFYVVSLANYIMKTEHTRIGLGSRLYMCIEKISWYLFLAPASKYQRSGTWTCRAAYIYTLTFQILFSCERDNV